MITGDSEQCRQGKLLSARMIISGTGKLMGEEVLRSLHEWGVADKVYAICFDTTASNTGK